MSGTGGAASGGTPSSGGSASGGTASGGTASGGSASGGTPNGGAAGAAGQASIFYEPPAAIIGGACSGTPVLPSMPCSDAPVQEYCSLSDPTRVIMTACTTAGRTQCEAVDECEPGWHACTATDYVARGGRDVAPSFSATNRAWLAACVRDVTGTQLKNEPCSVCGQDVGYPPSIQWWCNGDVVYEGGMSGDTLGIHTSPNACGSARTTPLTAPSGPWAFPAARRRSSCAAWMGW